MLDPTTLDQIAGDSSIEEEFATDASTADLIEEELLVEEISIDGMCGVY